uniref:Uncharacterized protein n=1 Tax=Panagrolaimus sp. PS1159 TaxID=55785 RepID=A0AC35GRM1_9BILA
MKTKIRAKKAIMVKRLLYNNEGWRADSHSFLLMFSALISKNYLCKLEEVELFECDVRNENGKILDVADLMKELPNINSFDYTFKFVVPNEVVTPETMQKLVELPTFPNLRKLSFFHIQEPFDLEAFGGFIRKNPTVFKENLLLTLPPHCYLNVVTNVDEDDA